MTPSHPITSGNRKWIFEQVKYLMDRRNEVFFLYVSCPVLFKTNNDLDSISQMKTFWGEHLIVYKAGIMSRMKLTFSYKFRKLFNNGYHTVDDLCPMTLPKYVRSLQQSYKFDACIVNYYWLTKVFDKLILPKKALNTHDCFSYRDINGGKYAWMTTTPNEEAKAMQRCNYIFALQEIEAHFFKYLAPRSQVLDVYCFFKYVPSQVVDNHNILLLSSNNQYNINGLYWFTNEVFPFLIEKFPDAKLIVGGSISETAIKVQNKSIEIKGYVDNPVNFFLLGDVCINPTYEGTGLKVKTLESIAYDKVTITRKHSIEGIFKPNETPILSSDSAKDWIMYFETIWNDVTLITNKKEENRCYIEKMNNYIDTQYDTFFS